MARKQRALAALAPALLAGALLESGYAVGHFDRKLSKDQQILQALNRLTFGPRAGDVERVRGMGVEKWIDLQLHPERIRENPELEARLKPLETLEMTSEELLKNYPPVAPALAPKFTPINELLTQDQVRRVFNGTAEERRALLDGLDPERRKQVLTLVPPQTLASNPDLQQEATMARQAQQEERTREMRRLLPPLPEVLKPDEVAIATRGTTEQRQALFASLDSTKRQQVAAALPTQALAEFRDMRALASRGRAPQQVVLADLKEAKIYRAVYSNRQLEAVLTDFWFNHFNVYEGKANVRPLLASYERDAIRPHVFGRFKDLLLATARHPAMLYFLDNWESVSPDAFQVGPFAGPAANMAQQLARQARGLNENYGREMLELHTLGVDGGYTQKDVIAVARCFTGWTIHQPNTKPEFRFAAFMHDSGEKTVLGHKIAEGGGEQDGLAVIDILAHHPATAKFISRKLAQRFVADDPPPALVDRMAQTFLRTDGDLRAVMQTMFVSREFFSEGAWETKVKTPLEMVVSAVRAVGGATTDSFTLAQRVADLGEPLYGKIEPTGYGNTSEPWLSTASIMGRINFATALAAGQIPGVRWDPTPLSGKDPAAVAQALLYREASPRTSEAIERGLQGKPATPQVLSGLLLSSPDFQRR